MKVAIIAVVLMTIAVSMTSAKPGILFTVPGASSQTSVVRDALGNQATAYAYQDGHSSAVAVARNDVSRHLAYVAPAPAVVYNTAPVYHQVHAPAYYYV